MVHIAPKILTTIFFSRRKEAQRIGDQRVTVSANHRGVLGRKIIYSRQKKTPLKTEQECKACH